MSYDPWTMCAVAALRAKLAAWEPVVRAACAENAAHRAWESASDAHLNHRKGARVDAVRLTARRKNALETIYRAAVDALPKDMRP